MNTNMHRLATLVALLTLALFGLAALNGNTDGLDLAIVGTLLAVTTWRGAMISRFLQILAVIFAAEFVVFNPKAFPRFVSTNQAVAVVGLRLIVHNKPPLPDRSMFVTKVCVETLPVPV